MSFFPGDLVRLRVDHGIGKFKKWMEWDGVVVSYYPARQNPFEKIGDIELLINGGELKRIVLFKSDEVEVVVYLGEEINRVRVMARVFHPRFNRVGYVNVLQLCEVWK